MTSSTQYILCELTKNLLEAPELPATHPIIKKATHLSSQNAVARQELGTLTAAQFIEGTESATANLQQLKQAQQDSDSQQTPLFTKQLDQQREQISKLNRESDTLHNRYRQLSDDLVQGLKDLIKHVTSGPKSLEKSQFASKELQRYNREQKKFAGEIAKHKLQCAVAQEQLERLNTQIYLSLPAEQRGMVAAPVGRENRARGN